MIVQHMCWILYALEERRQIHMLQGGCKFFVFVSSCWMNMYYEMWQHWGCLPAMWLFGLYDYGTCQMWKRARNIMHCIEKSCMIGWNQTVSLSGGISCSALWKWSNGCRGYVDHEQLGSNSYFHTYLCGQ